MLFTKFEPVDDEDDYIQAFSHTNKKCQKSIDDVKFSSIVRPSPFDIIPDEIIGKIASGLPFNDLVSLRQTCDRMNEVYRRERDQLAGPDIHVFVNLEDGQVVTSFRGHRQLRGEARLIAPSNRNMVFRNADITLTLRLGDTPMTPEASAEISRIFKRSNIQRFQLRSGIVSQETMHLINSLECSNVELNIGRFNENVQQVRNIKELRVREHLLFFQLNSILRMHIKSLSVRVTAASMPHILQCIDEWKESRREILSWFFKIPIIDVHRVWEDVGIDWRRSLAIRHDRSARLRVNSRIEPLEAGELIQYQTVSWFLN